jgi:predicted N-formylglutamate amidohydrolase
VAIDAFLITCEHGGNRIPASWRSLFHGYDDLLNTHRGYDPGALLMARKLARSFAAPLVTSTVSRLLVDLNRSLGHPQLFSKATRLVAATRRSQIIEQHYLPYRQRVENHVRKSVLLGRRVVHISSHSFTPVLDDKVRNADVGLLYDPGREGEVQICARWKTLLAAAVPELRVRRNYPYAGKGDGLTSYLRRRFPSDAYVGIELEVNQGIVLTGGPRWAALRGQLTDTLHKACTTERPVHGASRPMAK